MDEREAYEQWLAETYPGIDISGMEYEGDNIYFNYWKRLMSIPSPEGKSPVEYMDEVATYIKRGISDEILTKEEATAFVTQAYAYSESQGYRPTTAIEQRIQGQDVERQREAIEERRWRNLGFTGKPPESLLTRYDPLDKIRQETTEGQEISGFRVDPATGESRPILRAGEPSGRSISGETLERRRVEGQDQQSRLAAWQRYRGQPDYGAAWSRFGQEQAGQFAQTNTWSNWFTNQYRSKLSQFRPEPFGKGTYRGLSPREAERLEERNWADYLQSQRVATREAWYSQSPYERGERPAVHAPRLRTVGPF